MLKIYVWFQYHIFYSMHYSHFIQTLKSRIKCLAKFSASSGHLVSAFVYGGNVDAIGRGEPLASSEIDLLLVVSGRLLPGELPLPKKAFHGFCHGMKIENHDVQLIFNGVPPVGYDGEPVLLDVIGDGLPNINECDASSVIVAHKPRITIYGPDVYEILERIPVNSNTRRILLETVTKYVTREFLNRTDSVGRRGVAKNSLFLASLLDEAAVRHLDKHQAMRIVKSKFPEMATYLDYFEDIVYSTTKCEKKELLHKYFQIFCKLYKKHCR